MILLPRPRVINESGPFCHLKSSKSICLSGQHIQSMLFAADRLKVALRQKLGLQWDLAAGWALPQEEIGLVMRFDPLEVSQPQGYHLLVTPERIEIKGHDPAGVYYGVCTLIQILQQAQDQRIPCLEVQDWPDFPVRGVMLDISRDKVYRMETLYELVDRLSTWKVNQLQLYTEHTFAYRNHPEVWSRASPMTGEEILELDAFCRERFIELVPNQNLFGHMERWLKHPRYAALAEIHGEFAVPWGSAKGPFSLSPIHPGSLELVRGILDELLPYFSSRTVNIGCDETFDLGQGQSKAACDEIGAGRVYLDYLLKLYAEVSRRGFRTQFWGDIINDHPELVPELPRDMIGLLWGYEASFPFSEQGERFAAAGVPFYVCPGTSSWNSIAGRTSNALGNLRSAAESGLKFGACGYLNTDWGDNGHWQVLPVSYLGFLAGAAYSWCFDSNRETDIPPALSRFAFEDASGEMGQLAYRLGDAHLETGIVLHNATVFQRLLVRSLPELASTRGIQAYKVPQALAEIERCEEHLAGEEMKRPDAALIRREYSNTMRLMRHACRRWEFLFDQETALKNRYKEKLPVELTDILGEYRAIWLERNRPGGLEDSMARFETARKDFEL